MQQHGAILAVGQALWERLQPIRHGDYGGTASTIVSAEEAASVLAAGEFTLRRLPLDDDEGSLLARLRLLVQSERVRTSSRPPADA